MSKPIIQIKIEGPQGSGKTRLINSIVINLLIENKRYEGRDLSNTEDTEHDFQLEDDFHIVQIRTKQIQKEGSDV